MDDTIERNQAMNDLRDRVEGMNAFFVKPELSYPVRTTRSNILAMLLTEQSENFLVFTLSSYSWTDSQYFLIDEKGDTELLTKVIKKTFPYANIFNHIWPNDFSKARNFLMEKIDENSPDSLVFFPDDSWIWIYKMDNFVTFPGFQLSAPGAVDKKCIPNGVEGQYTEHYRVIYSSDRFQYPIHEQVINLHKNFGSKCKREIFWVDIDSTIRSFKRIDSDIEILKTNKNIPFVNHYLLKALTAKGTLFNEMKYIHEALEVLDNLINDPERNIGSKRHFELLKDNIIKDFKIKIKN